MRARPLVCMVLLAVLTGCGHKIDPYAFVMPGSMIDRETKRTQIEAVLKLLPRDEHQIVEEYESDADDKEQQFGFPVDNLTIASIIKLQRPKWEKEQADIAAAKKRQEEYEKRKAERLAEMGNAVQVNLLNKQSAFVATDRPSGDNSDQVVISVGIQNKSSKAIRLLKGTLSLTDTAGPTLADIPIEQKGIGAGKTVLLQLAENVSRDQSGRRFMSLPLARIKATFMPDLLTFSDGQSLDMKVLSP